MSDPIFSLTRVKSLLGGDAYKWLTSYFVKARFDANDNLVSLVNPRTNQDVSLGGGGSDATRNSGSAAGKLFNIPAEVSGYGAISQLISPTFTFTTASIAGNVLTVNGLAAGPGVTGLVRVYPDPVRGTRVTCPGCPDGTRIGALTSGGGTGGTSFVATLVNDFGADLSGLAVALGNPAATGIKFPARHNSLTSYKSTADVFAHTMTPDVSIKVQGLDSDGTRADKPLTEDVKIYAVAETISKDGLGTKVYTPYTWGGKDHLFVPKGTIPCTPSDVNGAVIFTDDLWCIKQSIVHADDFSPFTIGVGTGCASAANIGLFESTLQTGADCNFLSSAHGSYWTGYKQAVSMNRPLVVMAKSWGKTAKAGWGILADSIGSNWNSYLQQYMNTHGFPTANLGKSGEGPYNFPANFAARIKALQACDGVIIQLGVNQISAAGLIGLRQDVRILRASGIKKIGFVSTLPASTKKVDIANSTVDANGILTTGAFVTGSTATTPISAGWVFRGAGLNPLTKVSAYIDGGTGPGSAGGARYQLVEADGSPYAGTVAATVALNPTGSDLTQTAGSTIALDNNAAMLADMVAGTGVDFYIDVRSVAQSPTNPLMWAPLWTDEAASTAIYLHPTNAVGKAAALAYMESINLAETLAIAA